MTTTTVHARRGADPPRRARRRAWIGLVISVPVAALGWLLWEHDAGPPPAAAAPRLTTTEVTSPSADPPNPVSWHPFAGIALPVSATAGPACVTAQRAACFAGSGEGAAFAAIHLLVRTFPFAGPQSFRPTIADQVVGRDKPAFARLTEQAYQQAARAAGVTGGAALPSGDGTAAGYQLDHPQGANGTSGTVTVHVLIQQTSGEQSGTFVDFAVKLTWQGGDWRLIAPDWGDWQTAATSTTNPSPDSYRSYDTTTGSVATP